MYRLFKTHNIRKNYEVDCLWDFETEDGSYKGKITVPTAWETIPELVNYKGKATYTKTMKLGGNVRLVFKGVSHTADVFADGKHIKHHYNAYTPFYADVCLEDGDHEIKIEVDNAYGENSALHIENDYYTFGGIIRPFIVEQLNDVVINYIHFTPYKVDGKWFAKTEVAIENKSEKSCEYSLELNLEEENICTEKINLTPFEKTVFEKETAFENVEEYNTENPKLYQLIATLYKDGVATDDLIDKVGFREIKIQGKEILLNGKPIKIMGFNRHECYNSLGSSIPLQAMMRDLALIKEAGANSIRTCHYPNDEMFLDLCDELGLLVWEEAHARALNEEKMSNPNFIPQSLACIEEMIENHYNHPSVIMWGILNECVSDTEFGRECYKTLYDKIDSLDKSRPKTSASNRNTTDICFDLEEIVSVNLYSMWYSHHSDKVSDGIKAIKDHMKETGNENKPFIISETGAGAIYGYRNENHCKWSEERQAEILEQQLTTAFEDSDICGVFIWQFCDVRVDDSWFYGRPGSNNNKGIVDEFRRKKLAFNTVKRIFEKYKA